MKPGYACDNDAGIYFEDNEVRRVVATRPGVKAYHVTRVGDRAVERVLEPELIAGGVLRPNVRAVGGLGAGSAGTVQSGSAPCVRPARPSSSVVIRRPGRQPRPPRSQTQPVVHLQDQDVVRLLT